MDLSVLAWMAGFWISGKLTYSMTNACFLPKIMTFAVCDFAQNSVHLVTMVKIDNAEPKVFHWNVIVAFEIHGCLAQPCPKSALALYNGRILQLALVSNSQSIWKICDEDSWLSHNGQM